MIYRFLLFRKNKRMDASYDVDKGGGVTDVRAAVAVQVSQEVVLRNDAVDLPDPAVGHVNQQTAAQHPADKLLLCHRDQVWPLCAAHKVPHISSSDREPKRLIRGHIHSIWNTRTFHVHNTLPEWFFDFIYQSPFFAVPAFKYGTPLPMFFSSEKNNKKKWHGTQEHNVNHSVDKIHSTRWGAKGRHPLEKWRKSPLSKQLFFSRPHRLWFQSILFDFKLLFQCIQT